MIKVKNWVEGIRIEKEGRKFPLLDNEGLCNLVNRLNKNTNKLKYPLKWVLNISLINESWSQSEIEELKGQIQKLIK